MHKTTSVAEKLKGLFSTVGNFLAPPPQEDPPLPDENAQAVVAQIHEKGVPYGELFGEIKEYLAETEREGFPLTAHKNMVVIEIPDEADPNVLAKELSENIEGNHSYSVENARAIIREIRIQEHIERVRLQAMAFESADCD